VRAFASIVALCGCIAGTSAGAEVLITPQEAALPSASAPLGKTRALSRAPDAELLPPSSGGVAVASPLQFKIRFVPHGGTTIDLAATRILYMKEPMVDLTQRVKKYMTASGIDMPAAEAPPGQHVMMIELTDSRGHVGLSTITLTVGP